jgi:hypothetical protein
MVRAGLLIDFMICAGFSGGLVRAADVQPTLSVAEVASLIPEIEAAEQALQNIQVESEAWVETRAKPTDPWVRTPEYVSSTAWLEGVPRGRMRVDVQKQVSEWREGPAPYYEEAYSMSFDGRQGRVAKKSFGYSGSTYPEKRGELYAEIPPRLNTGWCNDFTGGRFSLYFFFKNDLRCSSFSQLLRKVTTSDVSGTNPFRFSVEDFQKVQCVKIASAVGGDKVRLTYWLDPSRSYALRGYELANIRDDGSEWLVSRIVINNLREAAPGVWWPVDASDESSSPQPGGLYRRFVYHASSVVANQKDLGEQLFSVPFAEGSLVVDRVSHVKFRGVRGQMVEQKK